MRDAAWPALLMLLGVVAAAVPAEAQVPSYLEEFEVVAEQSRADVPIGGQASLFLTYRDLSRDSAGTLQPGGPGVIYHNVRIEAVPVEEKAGWQVQTLPIGFSSAGGQTRQIEVQFQAEPSASDPYFEVEVRVTFTGPSGQSKHANVTMVGYSPGLAAYTVQVSETYLLKPRQIVDVPIKIRNTALVPRLYDMEVVSNPCGLVVATTNGNGVAPRTLQEYTVSMQAPARKFWYPYDSCQVAVEVRPQDNPNQVRTAIVNIQVAGFYVDPQWVIWAVEALLALLLLAWLVARRKARVEEEILGKPQKPWTIPVEALYLKALRQKDERAWYVVRHHLMEEEHRSALLWYKSYKSATKGTRRKEALVLRQEKAYARWRRSWERAIATPLKEADRFEARLQRKLDRRAAKLHRKALGKHAAVVSKMQKGHASQVERALAAWEKESRKAAKKGLPAPKRPSVAEPDYPEEPAAEPIALADHKWARRAGRFRARKVRQQGDLEVRFEKADARRLRKLRRKVQRLARRLDDPEFVAEHPLLQQA